MNKISLDLKFRNAEAQYFKYFDSAITKYESLFQSNNAILEEIKKVKIDEIFNMQMQTIENNNAGQIINTGDNTYNTPNNKSLFNQQTFDKKNSPQGMINKNPTGNRMRMSFFMANNENNNNNTNELVQNMPPNYLHRKTNHNLIRKVTRVSTNKGPLGNLEGLKRLKMLNSNLDSNMNKEINLSNPGFSKNLSSNSIVNLSKVNNNINKTNDKNEISPIGGLFKTEFEQQQNNKKIPQTNTITEADENEDKTQENFYVKKDKKKAVQLMKGNKIIHDNKNVSFKRNDSKNSASSFDSQVNDTEKNDVVNTVESKESKKSNMKDRNKDDTREKFLKIVYNPPNENNSKIVTSNTVTENTQSKLHTTNTQDNNTFMDEAKIPNSLKYYTKKRTFNGLNGSYLHNPIVRRRVSKLDLMMNEQNSSFCPINSFIGGSVFDGINGDGEKYITEIKQLKSEINMYKTYIGSINDKLENEVKLKNSYMENLKEFEKRNKNIYKTEIDNLHSCFEIYKEFYQNELDHRKDVIVNLHTTLEEVLAK